MRLGRWKLIEFFESGACELYDLNEDIGERSDLASQRPDMVSKLRGLLHDWQRDVCAVFPTPNEG